MSNGTQHFAPVAGVTSRAYEVPTDAPESDGTLEWDSTTLVAVMVRAGSELGLGYTYGHRAIADLVTSKLAPVVTGRDPLDIEGSWLAMHGALRNLGRPGLAAMSIAAVDIALWDLKARLLGVSLSELLGRVRAGTAIYGSGGFTSYSLDRLRSQLGGWAEQGIKRVKMKVGREPSADVERASAARAAIGDDVELFVDANGAYTRKQALWFAGAFADLGTTWFEEPVSSDDLESLSLLRDRVPAGMNVAAGEYGYDLFYFRRMLEAQAVDVLQADATRCAGLTGFIKVSALCEAYGLPLSAHTAPALHAHVCCACPPVTHIEYFHDHTRIEEMLLDGSPTPQDGVLVPDWRRPGLGLELKEQDAEEFAVKAG